MPTRDIGEYLGTPKSITANKRFSITPGKVNPKRNYLYQLKDFFTDNWYGWLVHNAIVRTLEDYPVNINNSIHELKSADGQDTVTLALTADWASDTFQSVNIANLIRQHKPDYTIHIGDTYYSGAQGEIAANFDPDVWYKGRSGSFALLGNHEMYSRGTYYFEMLEDFGVTDATGNYNGQEASFFCLRNDHWIILGLDTGYDSLKEGLHLNPDDTELRLPDLLMKWLNEHVNLKNDKRGVIILTHHQYISGFNNEENFQNPASQLQSLLPDREVIWIWGHEHRFAMYGRYKEPTANCQYIPAYGRCIGNGGLCDEHTDKRVVDSQKAEKYNLVLYDHRIADTFKIKRLFGEKDLDVGYNGYVLFKLKGNQVCINYYTSYSNKDNALLAEKCIIKETWTADNTTGKITCSDIEDMTVENGKSALSYCGNEDPNRAGNKARN